MYEIDHKDEYGYTVQTQVSCTNPNCITIWHRRLGHKNYESIKYLVNQILAEGISLINCKHDTVFTKSIEGKLSKLPYPKIASNRSKEVLSLIHIDICGPMRTETFTGKMYFITFKDDYSRFTMIYLLSHKGETLAKLQEFIAILKYEFSKQIKASRSDNAGEYLGDDFENFLTINSIETAESSLLLAPKQRSRKANRALVEMARTMLSDANLPKTLLGRSNFTATYLTNHSLTKANNNGTPFQL